MQELLHSPGELAFHAADEPSLVCEALESDVRDRRSPPDRVQLVLVLHSAELLDEPVARNGLDLSRMQPRVVLERQRGSLEADPSRQLLRQRLEEIALGLDELDAVDCACAPGVPEVRVEPHALRLDKECRIRAREAAEVAHVRRARDEERLLQALPQSVYPAVHVVRL